MRAFVTLLFIGLALSGCASLPGGGFSVAAPEWAPGHTWTFSQSYLYSVDSEHEKTSSEGVGEEDTVYTVLRNDTVWDADGWYLHVTGDSIDVPGLGKHRWSQAMWVDQHDLASAQVDSLIDQNCDIDGCTARVDAWPDIDGAVEAGSFLRFPLQSDASWRTRIDGANYTTTVLGSATVETGLGEQRAVHIQMVMDEPPYEQHMYEDWGATVHRYELDVEQVVDLYYVPDVEWFGRVEVTETVHFDIDIEWEDGERDTDSGTYHVEQTVILEDYDLAEADPASDEELIDLLLSEGRPIDGPYPLEMVPVDANVTVVLQAPDEINIADGGGIAASVTASGDNAPFRHEWILTSPDAYYGYNEGADAEGAAFNTEVEDLGTHMLMVRTFDANGTYVDVQTHPIEAFYAATFEGSCSLAVRTLDVGSCDAFDFRVDAGGWWDADITVVGTYDGGILQDGRLELYDPQGYVEATKDLSNGKATISGEFWGGEGLWSTRIIPPTGGDDGTPVTYEVEVRSAAEAWIGGFYH